MQNGQMKKDGIKIKQNPRIYVIQLSLFEGRSMENHCKQEIRSVEHGICPIAEFASP